MNPPTKEVQTCPDCAWMEFTYHCPCGKNIVVSAKLDQELLVCPYCMGRLNPPQPPVIPSKEFP